MLWKRKLIAAAVMGTGFAGAGAFNEYQAARSDSANLQLSTIGAPLCAPQRTGPQYKTFFRLAMAESQDTSRPAKTEVGPFSKAIPSAESLTSADANPGLAGDLGPLHYGITTSVRPAQDFFNQGL